MALWGKNSAKPLATQPLKCPSGKHAMSSTWTECPYCKTEQASGQKTQLNDLDDSRQPAPEAANSAVPGPTRINVVGDVRPDNSSNNNGGGRETKILPEAADAGFASYRDESTGNNRHATRIFGADEAVSPVAARKPNAGRKLTGIVITFSWSAQGRLYEIREGRNYGGSGTVAIENHRDADLLINEDSSMSSTHFLILCQGGKYRIKDSNSTNGTYVDGELIDDHGIDLVDGARIQAGATLMLFKKITPPTPVPLASAAE